MSTTVLNIVRKGFYLDSVALMRMSRVIAEVDGVEEAAMMMGTPSNREIMSNAGLLAEAGEAAGGGDLIIGVRARDKASAEAALTEASKQLDQPTRLTAEGTAWCPRTLRAALKVAPKSNLALISVPGAFAAAEARKAIERGLDAMIFSDNVDLAEEVELKREAMKLGRLVMGPDCGTAIINGTPLAFANVVPRGDVGIIGASGTGMQEVSCLIGHYGAGVSHAIGVGGRDLKSEVGGISTLTAIDILEDDSETKRIVLISKPPAADVSARVLDRIATCGKPTTVCFIGSEALSMPTNAVQVSTLKAAARVASGLTDNGPVAPEQPIRPPAGRKMIRGFYSGGTLCAEAQVLFRDVGVAVSSNAPIPGVHDLTNGNSLHCLIDLGDDEYTQGKPHPMIDPTVRDQSIKAALSGKDVSVVLVDVVIGYGAHPDPAGHLCEIVRSYLSDDGPIVIASVTGTEADPQRRSAQIEKLTAAGIIVAPTNADAAAWTLSTIQSQA